MQSKMTSSKTGEVSCYQNLKTLWPEPGVSPHEPKANSLITHHFIPQVNIFLWLCSLAITSTGLVGLWFCGLCPGTPEDSTGSGSGFKASQKTGPQLKVSSDRLGEAGNPFRDP